MITDVFGVSVWSEDQRALVPFYRDVLQLPVMLETDGFAVFGQPGGATLLVGTHSNVHGPNGDPSRHIVSLRTDDVDVEFARLTNQGVSVIEPPSLQWPGLRIATLADPEGNVFSLVQTLDS